MQLSYTYTTLPSQKVEGLDKNFGDNDYGIATERQCMERAPSDNQERCAFVKHNHKQVRGGREGGKEKIRINPGPPTTFFLISDIL